jgi:hypothetical protein
MLDDEHIEISFDGEAKRKPTPRDQDRLVITTDDLLSMPDKPAPGTYPGLPSDISASAPGMPFIPQGKGDIKPPLGAVLRQMALAGAIGGFLAWVVTYPFMHDLPQQVHHLGDSGNFGAALGGCIGLALGAVDGIVGRVYQKALTSGGLGLAIGCVGGGMGGIVGQIIYSMLGGGYGGLADVLARTIGWAAIGMFVGLGQGVAMRSKRKILQGLLGGLLGGAIGGLLFDVVSAIVHAIYGYGGGPASRAIAITILGICAGAAIGMVEEIAKQAWLRITQGPMAGKEFIIYLANTSIGSSPKCDITIPKDTDILPQHCVIHATGRGYALSSVDPRAPAFVNGHAAPQVALRDGDTIRLGHSLLLYAERAAKNAGRPAPYAMPPSGLGGK